MPSQKFLRDVTNIECKFLDNKRKCKFYGYITTLEGKKERFLDKFRPIYILQFKDTKINSFIQPVYNEIRFTREKGLNCSIIKDELGYNIHCIEEE